ncbi:hypothetical protein [Pseudomonas quasicaspiana]|uniref:hypothetical protein n=1 Tax=Pseudomonas quasicaspiana TaxID=2829821 RepID=UPI001E648E90|nr:hypothetical protein [Pseudomonas quasicaspiana]MCD5972001.1 hypothetical protein [Pseudomonas quasicaspiana]
MDGFLLGATLLLPILLSLVCITHFLGKGEWGFQRITSILKLDTAHGLIRQGLLWLAILIPLGVGVSLGSWVWLGRAVDLSQSGFNTFIEISILPLAIVSVALPLAGLVSRFHSTQQTAKQIEVVSYKNNLDAFYTHRKELISYFSAIPDIKYFNLIEFEYGIHPVLHVRFFLGSPEKGFPRVNRGSFDYVERRLLSAAKFMLPVLEGRCETLSLLDLYLNACNDVYLAAKALHVKKVTHELIQTGVLVSSKKVAPGEYDMLTIGTTTLEMLASIRFVKGCYDNLCDFAGEPRLEIPKMLDDVFNKTEKYISKELVIERLHKWDLAGMVASGRACYDVNHERRVKT